MNTIKIKLSSSGRIASLDKNFPLYCGQFQNVLLNILVPTSILYSGFEVGQCLNSISPSNSEEINSYLTAFIKSFTNDPSRPHKGDVVFYIYDNAGVLKYYRAVYNGTSWGLTEVPYFAFGEAGANVKIGMVGTQTNGVVFKTKSYYTRYVKKFTVEGVEYALYERQMPRDFAATIGEQTLVINVTNVNFNGESAKVENIVTSQTAMMNILPSTLLDKDEEIEASELENIQAEVAILSQRLDEKQNIKDPSIDFTTEKTVVGALNDLNDREVQDRADLDAVIEQADDNSDEIEKIKDGTTTVPNASTATYDSAGNNIAQKFAGLADGTIKVKNAENADIAEVARKDTSGNNIAAQFASVISAIQSLEAIVGSGEDFIGRMTTDHLPSNAELSQFVYNTVNRAPKGGDSVIVVLEISGQTDENYKYIYTGTTWEGYEIPPVELASNGSAGIIKGTYHTGSTNNVLIDIENGEIKNILVYDQEDDIYYPLSTIIPSLIGDINGIRTGTITVGRADIAAKDGNGNNIALSLSNIVNGVTKVGAAAQADSATQADKDGTGTGISAQFSDILDGTAQVGRAAYAAEALKATQDALGNNIVNTYLTQALGATKQYVKDYALPKEFNNVLYLASNGFTENIPTTPASGIQFQATSSSIGETTLFSTSYTLGDIKFQLSSKNSASARFFIEAIGGASTVQFKLLTYATKAGQTPTLLSAELLTEQDLPTTLTAINFNSPFTSLNNSVIDLVQGDSITMTLIAILSESASTTFDVYSNATYPSRINLNTGTVTVTYRVSEIGETVYIPLTTNDLTVANGSAYFVTDNADFISLVNNLLNGEIEISIPDLSLVSGITETSNIYINNIPLSSAKNTPAELKDFETYKRQNGAYLLFGLLRNSASEIAINAPNISTIPKTAKETKQVAANAWSADANISPFEYSYTTTFLQDNTIFGKVTLVASPIILAKYGIVIGEISGTSVTFYAQELPSEAVDLTLLFENEQEQGASRATDQYGNPLTDQYGVQLYLE